MLDRPVLVFDVNETLLDLSGLDAPFQEVFGHAAARDEWFRQVLRSALVSTITGPYADFSAIGRTALQLVATRRGVALSAADRSRILDAMRRLPPHPDVADSLERLQAAGFRIAALSNGAPDVLHDQMVHADLDGFFDAVLSADAVQRLKPAPEPYHMAAQQLDVEIGALCMVAAHAWDITGALRAGASTAFVARPGKVLDPLGPAPDIVGPDLAQVAGQLIDAHAADSRSA
jgi:2-haloacid dehalogenase